MQASLKKRLKHLLTQHQINLADRIQAPFILDHHSTRARDVITHFDRDFIPCVVLAMKPIIIILLCLLFVYSSVGATASISGQKPNILLIIADDMGYSDLSCYGGEIETPNLSALAAGGLRFTNFYVNNMCWPTRASLMTSLYPRVALPINGSAEGGLHPKAITLPQTLKSAGYKTYMAGKWHLSAGEKLDGPNAPHHKGFDHFYGTIHGAGSFYAPSSLTLDGEDASDEFINNPDYYYTDALTDHALNFLDDRSGTTKNVDSGNKDSAKPFFLYLSYTAAHWPLHARPDDIAHYKGRYAKGWDELRKERHARMKKIGVVNPSWQLSPRHSDVPAWQDAEHKDWQQRRMEVYAAQITRMDFNIGRVVDHLKESGQFKNTLILYMQDNGACHVEYGVNRKGAYLPLKTRDGRAMRPGNIPGLMPGPEDTYQSYGYGWANASNTPFRLFKQHDHEGGTRSPLIVSWPVQFSSEGLKPGSITGEVCHAIDILPTLEDAAGADSPEEQLPTSKLLTRKGSSFYPVLTNEAKERKAHEALFWAHARGSAVRKGDYKLVRIKGQSWELYNVKKDGTELNDLASSMPGRVADLEKLFQSWLAEEPPQKKKKKSKSGKRK